MTPTDKHHDQDLRPRSPNHAPYSRRGRRELPRRIRPCRVIRYSGRMRGSWVVGVDARAAGSGPGMGRIAAVTPSHGRVRRSRSSRTLRSNGRWSSTSRRRLGYSIASAGGPRVDASAATGAPSRAGDGPDCGVRVRPWLRALLPCSHSAVRFHAVAGPMERPAIPRKAGVEGSNPSVGLERANG